MNTTRIAIIGGGLSGLYAAFLLQQQGIDDYLIIEARDSIGGRILSTNNNESINRFDLGPTWFWPEMQPELNHLIHQLGLQTFAQFEDGDLLVERSPQQSPSRVPGYVNAPTSMRLVSGMTSLIEALHTRLDSSKIITGCTARKLNIDNDNIEIECEKADGNIRFINAKHILLALPPRLAVERIQFQPKLPDSIVQQWRNTPTWMAPHAKYIAVYEKPFWREAGLSGAARSAHGPLVEIHDASMPEGKAALFGFFGIPAQVRKNVTTEMLQSHCRMQLVRLFGHKAATPTLEFIKDWAIDPFTATEMDMHATGHHAQAPVSRIQQGAWCNRITGIASEWSLQFPGYLAGAIEAADLAIQDLLHADKQPQDNQTPFGTES